MSTDAAPLLGSPSAADAYIVVYHDATDADVVTDALAADLGFTPKHVFRHALLGFAASLSADALDAVRRHPAVKYVEHDGEMGIA
jgi:hypothetical protein